mmetsp:Transcript_6385/g.15565  ORF Transcript_6385/g.15565 Transcript_6385/m.15565 type:complete len:452 (-) Transcript_6385:4321-5676(-)
MLLVAGRGGSQEAPHARAASGVHAGDRTQAGHGGAGDGAVKGVGPQEDLLLPRHGALPRVLLHARHRHARHHVGPQHPPPRHRQHQPPGAADRRHLPHGAGVECSPRVSLQRDLERRASGPPPYRAELWQLEGDRLTCGDVHHGREGHRQPAPREAEPGRAVEGPNRGRVVDGELPHGPAPGVGAERQGQVVPRGPLLGQPHARGGGHLEGHGGLRRVAVASEDADVVEGQVQAGVGKVGLKRRRDGAVAAQQVHLARRRQEEEGEPHGDALARPDHHLRGEPQRHPGRRARLGRVGPLHAGFEEAYALRHSRRPQLERRPQGAVLARRRAPRGRVGAEGAGGARRRGAQREGPGRAREARRRPPGREAARAARVARSCAGPWAREPVGAREALCGRLLAGIRTRKAVRARRRPRRGRLLARRAAGARDARSELKGARRAGHALGPVDARE